MTVNDLDLKKVYSTNYPRCYSLQCIPLQTPTLFHKNFLLLEGILNVIFWVSFITVAFTASKCLKWVLDNADFTFYGFRTSPTMSCHTTRCLG